jgi:AcrR family transcriptional regulator
LTIPSRPTRRTRAKHGGQKQSIDSRLLAATERLLEQGNTFATLSIEQLTKEAGIARGTFYLHFKDKGELVARLFDHILDELTSNLGTWTANAAVSERKDVAAAVGGMIKVFKKHRAIIIAVRDTMPHDKEVEKIYTGMINKIANLAMSSVSIIKQRGKSREETTTAAAEMLAQLIGLYCTYLLDKRSSAKSKIDIEALSYICVSTIFADGE